MKSTPPIFPPEMLGIIGGGQLGRMFTVAAKTMGYRVMVLEPDVDCPAGSLADVHLKSAYTDPEALRTLASACKGVTTEFENVPADVLNRLAQETRVAPSGEAVSIAQDRIREKAFLCRSGLRVAPYLAVETAADLAQDLSAWLPGILKVARLGYDGKGQIRVRTAAEVIAAHAALGHLPCVLERQLDLRLEVSVIVARTSKDRVTSFAVAENQHVNGILDLSVVPARISEEQAEQARLIALSIAEALDYTGVLGVELFILETGDILVNEIAPRPHNSGHYTLDATVSSQFEQQVRTLCGLPPLETRLLSPAVMINLLGDLWGETEPHWNALMNHPRALLHLYGKQAARPGRKMGHINILSDDLETALIEARALHEALNAG